MVRAKSGTVHAPRQRAVLTQQQMSAMHAGRAFLHNTGRRLTYDELKLVYVNVFPRAKPTKEDLALQQGAVMSADAVAAQLGEDMQETYSFLTGQMRFPYAGRRPHNFDSDSPRHQWDTAYRAHQMGMPLQIRQLTLAHSLPEHKARGIVEAKEVIEKLGTQFGDDVIKGLKGFTDWTGIVIDHLWYHIERTGSNGKPNFSSATRQSSQLDQILRRINAGAPTRLIGHIAGTLDEVVRLDVSSQKRLIPAEFTGGNYVFPEAKALLHPMYVEDIQQNEIRKGSANPNYSYGPLIVKGLCLIDRLRTVTDIPHVEKVTRETMDFLPCFDAVLAELQRLGQVNNNVEFVAAALKAELITELELRAIGYAFMRDTTFTPAARMLSQRLSRAKKHYGTTASDMGYQENPNAFLLTSNSPGLRHKV